MKKINCKCCDKEYEKGTGAKRNANYCSSSCEYIKTLAAPGFKYRLVCSTCDKEFLTNRRKDTKYCSNKCESDTESRKTAREQHYKERRTWLDDIKMKAGCVTCGFDTHPAALHFDHIKPSTKTFNISQDMKRSKALVIAEIAKCQVLCANCHSIRTYTEGHSKFRKGTDDT